MTSWGKSRSCVQRNRSRLNAKATRSSISSILSYRIPWMTLNPTLSPTQLTKLNLRCQKVRQCFLRQKLILLADKSEFGWKTVEQYTQHELADNEEDGKKIRRAEERAERALKSTTSKRPINQSSSLSRPSSSSRFASQYFRSSSLFGSFRNQRDRLSYPRSPDVSSRPGNCFACDRFGHWRSECTQIGRSVSEGISGNRWQGDDKQSKSELSSLTVPCDFFEDLSVDSFQESKNFELELEIPVVSAPVVQQISVKGKLFKSIRHWQSLGAPDFILSVIRDGYRIPRRRLAVSLRMPQAVRTQTWYPQNKQDNKIRNKYFNLSTPLVAHDIILGFLWLMLSQMKRRKPTDTEHVN